jgi:hypothetical protein
MQAEQQRAWLHGGLDEAARCIHRTTPVLLRLRWPGSGCSPSGQGATRRDARRRKLDLTLPSVSQPKDEARRVTVSEALSLYAMVASTLALGVELWVWWQRR